MSQTQEPKTDQFDSGEAASSSRAEINQSTAETVTAETVWVTQSAVRNLTMHGGSFTQSAAAKLTTEDIALHDSSVGALMAGQVDLYDSTVAFAFGPLTVKEGTAAVFLHIGQSDCSVKPVLDAKSAAAVGAGIGLGLAIFGRVLGRIFTG